MEISGAENEPVVDWLHPEWANLRIIPERTVAAGMRGQPLERMPRAVMVLHTRAELDLELPLEIWIQYPVLYALAGSLRGL